MRLARALFAILVPLALTGCGYVHFGRMPTPVAGQGDAAMAAAYTNLATEHKILKQELALARKEGDALRAALDRSGSGSAGVSAAEVSARLSDTTRELAALRASYAKLQGERTGASAEGSPAAVAAAKSELEEKLAVSLRNFTELQEENARLRSEVTRARADNESLTEKLKAAALQAERTQATLAQLNTDLIAQKEARARAEQAAESVRAQLGTVLAHGSAAVAAGTREPSALQIAKAPPRRSFSHRRIATGHGAGPKTRATRHPGQGKSDPRGARGRHARKNRAAILRNIRPLARALRRKPAAPQERPVTPRRHGVADPGKLIRRVCQVFGRGFFWR